jgi:hypothetical protein
MVSGFTAQPERHTNQMRIHTNEGKYGAVERRDRSPRPPSGAFPLVSRGVGRDRPAEAYAGSGGDGAEGPRRELLARVDQQLGGRRSRRAAENLQLAFRRHSARGRHLRPGPGVQARSVERRLRPDRTRKGEKGHPLRTDGRGEGRGL